MPMAQGYHSRFDSVFLDFEGTLNDTQASGRLYARDFIATVGRMHPGEPARWIGAIITSLADVRALQEKAAAEPWLGYDAYRRRELVIWLRSLYGAAGVALPDEDDQVYRLAWELEEAIPVRFAPLSGVDQTIRDLAARGLRLHIASGANSRYVSRCLSDGGLIELFCGVYGPDNLDTLKSGADFFRRAFSAAGCVPSHCLVVDDSPGPVRWALEAGARAIQVGPDPSVPAEGPDDRRTGQEVVCVSSLEQVVSVVNGMSR